jgi:NAD(P)-dependent dehydrogenase (short-subunit alcohol dehydrogenase family)
VEKLTTLEGKKALITGSRRGIGRGIALALAEQGCDIGLNDIEHDASADRTIRLVSEAGRKCTFTVADISKSESVNALFDEFIAEHGQIDILVNNAYWSKNMPFLEISESVWDRTIEVSLKGYFLCSQRASREMVKQNNGGRIVSISSIHAVHVWETDTAYAVAKSGIIRLTMSMARELAGTRITANAIAPGYIDSRELPPEREAERGKREPDDRVLLSIPSRRDGVPNDIGQAVVFLCSRMGDYVNGTCLTVDGGFLTHGNT